MPLSTHPRVSVITAIHGQEAMNCLFMQSLEKYSAEAFELIIVDNASQDGSADFFVAAGAKVIRNGENFSYPYSQNQGIAVTQGEYLAFLNNDIIVAPQWDSRLIASMKKNNLLAVTSCRIERCESTAATRYYSRRWQLIKNVLEWLSFSRKQGRVLSTMHRLMYGDWQTFSQRRADNFLGQTVEGFVGNTVMLSRQGLELLGVWDERVQAADFDLYLRSKMLSKKNPAYKPLHIALDVFNHHYIRLTARQKYPPFADRHNLMSLDEKWQALTPDWRNWLVAGTA